MKKFTIRLLSFVLVLLSAQTIKAQDVIFEENFVEGKDGFVVEGNNGASDEIWSWRSNYEAMIADAFGKIGKDEQLENYLVSPSITLGKENVLTFDQTNSYFQDVTQEAGVYVRETGTTEWVQLDADLSSNQGGIDPSALKNIGEIAIPDAFDGKEVQIGFRYSSPGDKASGLWIITNIVVKGFAAPVPEEDVILYEEDFLESMGDFVVEGFNGEDNNIWSWDDYYKVVVADAYGKIGPKEELENYLVSPEITLATNNKVTFSQNNMYFAEIANEAGLCIREAGTTDWVKLEVELPGFLGDVTNVGDIAIPSEFDGKTVQFGFMYTSPGGPSSGLWLIAKFAVKASVNDPTSIEGVTENEITDNNIYDLQGRRVMNPSKGLYIVNGKKIIIR